MIGTTFAAYVRKLTKTNSTTLPDADLVLYANIEKDDLAELITNEVGEDYFLLPFKRDLVAGQREYSVPTEVMLHNKRVSAMLDGTKYSLLEEMDANMIRLPLVTEIDITTAFAGKKPAYDWLDRGIKIFSEVPIIDVTDGIWFDTIQYPEDISDSNLAASTDLSVPSGNTKTRLPKAAHKVWALRTSIAYKNSRPKPLPYTREENNIEFFENRMMNNLRGRNLDRSYVPPSPYEDGSNY